MDISISEIIEKISTAQKAVQASAISAEIAFDTQKGATEAINSLIQVIQHQNEEIKRLKSELENQKLQKATTKGYRVLTPEEVARHDSELDPKECCD